MSTIRNKFSPEFRGRVVLIVEERRGDYPSEWVALTPIAGKVGCMTETLRRWRREEANDERGRGSDGRQAGSGEALEREVKEPRRANEFLRKASAYFARPELDRHGKW